MSVNKKRVLVVDDEENLRHMMRIILSRSGYEVFEAENGEKALEAIQKKQADLILCDIRMPRMVHHRKSVSLTKNRIRLFRL